MFLGYGALLQRTLKVITISSQSTSFMLFNMVGGSVYIYHEVCEWPGGGGGGLNYILSVYCSLGTVSS